VIVTYETPLKALYFHAIMSEAEGQPGFVGRPYKTLTCAEGTLKVLILHQVPAPFIGRIVADNQPGPLPEQNVRNLYMSRNPLTKDGYNSG